MKNGLVPRSASRSEPTQSFQHHGQGHAAFFFFSQDLRLDQVSLADALSLTAFVLRSQKQRGTQQPVNLTSVPVGSQSIREALILQDSEDPVQARAQTYYWLC